MKKQINLYPPSCYPKREKATFTQFLLLFVVCLSASALSYFVVNKRVQTLNEAVATQKNKMKIQQSQLSNLVIKLKKNRAPKEKLRRYSMLENEIKAKQRLLASLSGIDVKELLSFSMLMRGLSYADMPDLTINNFSMVNGVLNIEGDAAQSDSVPLWLSKIQQTNELSAITFTALSIKEQEGFFHFKLTNSALKGKN